MRIERVSEPKKLFLAWQAPEHLLDRHRWAVAEIVPSSEGELTLRYFVDDHEFQLLNSGRSRAEMARLGYAGFPAFRPDTAVHGHGVLAALLRRLPSRSRPDYDDYLQAMGFAEGVRPSPLALISYTEAKLPSDGFSVVDPLDPADEDVDTILELAGSRYYLAEPLGQHIGKQVELRPEPANAFDPHAIQVLLGEGLIGYINRLQAPTVGAWLARSGISAFLHRVNGTADRPRVYVFIRVRPTGTGSRIAA